MFRRIPSTIPPRCPNRIVPGLPIPRPRMEGAQQALQSRQPQKPLGRTADLPLERLRQATRREADRPGDLMHGRAQFAGEDSVAQGKRRRHGRGHNHQTTSEPVADDALSGMEITGLEQWTNQTVVSSRVYGRQLNSTSGKARKLHSGQGDGATARQNGGKHRRRNIGPGGRWRENRPPQGHPRSRPGAGRRRPVRRDVPQSLKSRARYRTAVVQRRRTRRLPLVRFRFLHGFRNGTA